MIKITERPLSQTERQQLSDEAPFFLLKNRREIWRQEVERGTLEVLELQVMRAWEVNICTCCPNSYLFQVDSEAFVFLESWIFTKFADVPNSFPRHQLKVERLPLSKKIMAIDIAGELLTAEKTQLASTDLPNDGDTECEVFNASEFSEELRSKLRLS
jgi:hypothetical protein